jgi:hypothetical protein
MRPLRDPSPRLEAPAPGRNLGWAVGHSFASRRFDGDRFAVAMIPMIARFVARRGGFGEEEARAWAAEQYELGERDEFYFAGTQFCFTAVPPQ